MGTINKWLDGKKTLISGIGAFGVFMSVVAAQLADGFQVADIQPILIAFSAVMAIFGFGGKLQKVINALNAAK